MKHNKNEREKTEEQSSNNPFKSAENINDTSSQNSENMDTSSDFNSEEEQDTDVNSDSEKQASEDISGKNHDDALQKKYEELNNQYIRLAADFDNFRKRQALERENLLKYGAEETMKKLLEVLDNFDRGLKAIETMEDSQQIKDSYALVCNQMNDVLKKLGLEVINSEGQEFNPLYHEAVMQTPTSEYPENTIITQLQKGYKLGDKVLRAALVNVATAE